MIKNPVPWPNDAKVACAITFDITLTEQGMYNHCVHCTYVIQVWVVDWNIQIFSDRTLFLFASKQHEHSCTNLGCAMES